MDYFNVLYHKNIKKEQIDSIIQLKEQHWKYGVESQARWIKNHIQGDDIHVLGYLEQSNKLVSYSHLVNVKANVDGRLVNCLGWGNLCVCKEYEHKGHAKEMIQFLNEYIRGRNEEGITLCKADKAAIYSRYSWNKVDAIKVIVENEQFNEIVMLLDCEDMTNNINTLEINRSF